MTQPAGPHPPPGPPVCPRHPDREAYVRCQRCDRPTCPECQRPAAVGIQCVDCLRDQARDVRQPRTVFGGRVSGGRPVVTLTLIGLNVVAYLLQRTVPEFTGAFAFAPFVAMEQPWRFLTSAFLHSPSMFLHIAFNMYALWLLGPYLENVLGRLRFAALYLVSAVGGSVGFLLLTSPADPSWFFGAVGASGAVFGLFAAVIVVNRRLGRRMGQIGVVIAINAVLPILFPVIAWEAHLGGAVTGAVLAATFAYAPRARRDLVQSIGVVAVLLVLALLTVVKLATV